MQTVFRLCGIYQVDINFVFFSVNNHQVVALVLEAVSLKIGNELIPETYHVIFKYIQSEKSKKSMSSNVIHHHQNPIVYDCRCPKYYKSIKKLFQSDVCVSVHHI